MTENYHISKINKRNRKEQKYTKRWKQLTKW
jgi:hypothetical protein